MRQGNFSRQRKSTGMLEDQFFHDTFSGFDIIMMNLLNAGTHMTENVVVVWKNGQQEDDCRMFQSELLVEYRLFLSLTHKGVQNETTVCIFQCHRKHRKDCGRHG